MPNFLSDHTAEIDRVSQTYAAKFDLTRNDEWFMLKLQEEVGELTQAFLAVTGRTRPKGETADELRHNLVAELADVYCHTLLLASHFGVDLEAAVKDKWLVWS